MFVEGPGGPLLGPPYLPCRSLISCSWSVCCLFIMAIIAAICALRSSISDMFDVGVPVCSGCSGCPGYSDVQVIAMSRGSAVVETDAATNCNGSDFISERKLTFY